MCSFDLSKALEKSIARKLDPAAAARRRHEICGYLDRLDALVTMMKSGREIPSDKLTKYSDLIEEARGELLKELQPILAAYERVGDAEGQG